MRDTARDDAPGTEEATRFQCDLYRYWRAVEHLGALRLSAHRYLTRSALRQLRGQLDAAPSEGDRLDDAAERADLRLYFVRRLLERLGLLRRDPERGLVAGARSEVERYFALALDERLRLAVKLWMAGGWWMERPDERQEPPGLRAPAHPAVAVGRRQALQALLETPPDGLLALDQLAPRGGRADLARHALPHTEATSRRRAAPPLPADTVASSLLGPLCWLGLAAREAQPGNTASAPVLRPTAALDALRAQPPDPPPVSLEEVVGPIRVGADFEVLAYPPLAARTLLTLDTCGEPVGSGVVARYRLSRAGVVRARRAGWPAGETVRRLAALAGALPQNVEVTLRDWERQADRIRLRTNLALLRVRIPRLLDALAGDAALGPAIVRRLSATEALILDTRADAVRQWLLRHGELPAMSPPVGDQ